MRVFVIILVFVHGSIHLLGFAKAFGLADITQFSTLISRPAGILWLLATVLFLMAGIALKYQYPNRALLLISALLLSQLLIFMHWQDTKYGSLPNLFFLVVAVAGMGLRQFEKKFTRDVQAAFNKNPLRNELVSEAGVKTLPPPVRKYLRYSGVVGKPKPFSMRLEFEGKMREKGRNWFDFTSVQYNFIDDPTRLFFMKARIRGIPVYGYHFYANKEARMQIKLAGLIPLVTINDPSLFPTETVTFFNDMCIFAPAALTDNRIHWEPIDDLSARATFTNKGHAISAVLYFNQEGQLINFISEDRQDISRKGNFPFSTPVMDYKDFSGYRLPSYGEAVWQYPDGDFIYGKFKVVRIAYNVKEPS